jgi:hypothetical protein
MTMYQIDSYISQVWYVVPMVRIRYYLKDIKHVLFSMFVKDYQAEPEYDEDENETTRKDDELRRVQVEHLRMGGSPETMPKRWADDD